MTKQNLLSDLANNTYVMIRPSPIEGIGVFAIQNIPKGCRKMFSSTSEGQEEWLKVSKAEIGQLPPHSRSLVETYCLYDADHYYVPEDGFKKMDLVLFLNHSETPNIISVNEGEFFEAIRDIQSGEELLVDYGDLVDEDEDDVKRAK
jgi:SET domain-containing protein